MVIVGERVTRIPETFCDYDFKARKVSRRPMRGTVVYVHPRRRYHTVAFALPGGFHPGYNALYMMLWYVLSLFACLGLRNTYEKAMDFKPTLANAAMTVLLILYCTLSLSKVSVFLYFNF